MIGFLLYHIQDIFSLIKISVYLENSSQIALMKLLTILDSRLRGNDMFFQSVTSLAVIPAKAGIQKLIDNWSILIEVSLKANIFC